MANLLGLLMEEHGEPEDGGPLVQALGKVLPVLVEAGGDAADVLGGVVVALDELGGVAEDPVDVGEDVLQRVAKIENCKLVFVIALHS